MSDIFGGATVPAWMTERAAETARRGHWGANAGTFLGGLINSFKRNGPEILDEEGKPTGRYESGPRQGFLAGLGEAKRNQTDPSWRLKEAQAKAATLGTMAQAQATHALALERQNENAGMIVDSPWLAKAAATSPDKFDADSPDFLPPQGFKSQGGWRTFIQISREKAAERNAVLKDKSIQSYKDNLTEMESLMYSNKDLLSRIQSLPNGGQLPPTSDGMRVYSPQALQEYESFRTNVLKLPPSGVTKNTAAAMRQQVINDAALQRTTLTGEQKKDIETLKAGNRITELNLKAENQERLQDKKLLGLQQMAVAKNEMHEDYTKKRIQWLTDQKKELMAIKAKEIEARDSIYAAPPKIYPQPDGSMIVTHGKSMQILKPAKNEADNLRLKTTVGTLAKSINTLSAMAIADPENETVRGQLLDEQIKMANVFQAQMAKKITAQQARTAPNPPPDEDAVSPSPAAQATPAATTNAPAAGKNSFYRWDEKLGKAVLVTQ